MTQQPMPVPNDRPSVQGLVRADLEERERVGVQRYGTPLQAHNGRDALRDAYEEAAGGHRRRPTRWSPSTPATSPRSCTASPETPMAADTHPNPHAGNWEGGYTDRRGQRWVHVPWQGWQPAPGPLFVATPRRGQRRAARVAKYLARAVLLAAALYCTIALTGTILGTAVGILINEWSRP